MKNHVESVVLSTPVNLKNATFFVVSQFRKYWRSSDIEHYQSLSNLLLIGKYQHACLRCLWDVEVKRFKKVNFVFLFCFRSSSRPLRMKIGVNVCSSKALQKRLLSLLADKGTFLTLLICFFLLIISTISFGEAW